MKYFISIRSTSQSGTGPFRECRNLSLFTLPVSLITMGNYFAYMTKISSVTIPSGVTAIGSRAFGTISTLRTITCLAVTPPTLDSYTFQNTRNIANIYVPAASVEAYKSASVWSTLADKITAIPE